MVYGGAGAGAAAAAAAIAQAIKASGAIIKLEPEEFTKILNRCEEPLIVMARSGFRKKKYSYLTAYKGLIFHTETTQAFNLPSKAEVIASQKIWIPS